jgi:hypothetical protein
MHDDTTVDDPLLQAISELRDELDRLIDEQRAILSKSDGEGPVAAAPVVRTETVVEPAAPSRAAAAESAPRPRKPAAIVAQERAPGPTRPDVVSVAEAAPDSRLSDDPKLRLDALAKHFDRKMRQACAPAGETSGRSSG